MNGPRAVCRLHGMQSADCTATVQSADCTVQSADCARFPDCTEHLYIPFSSDHPRSCFRAFIRAELLRYDRTNSDISQLTHVRTSFWARLRSRGYPHVFLTSQFAKTPPCIDNSLPLCSAKYPAESSRYLSFVTQYHPHLLSIQKLLKVSFSAKIGFFKSKKLF